MNLSIRLFDPADWPLLWPILRDIVQAGDTYSYAPDSAESAIHAAWIQAPACTWVACEGDRIVGSYYLKANQTGLGSHVCNAGYMVAPEARGYGVAALMCEHSQAEAIAIGFRAMQFNLVVSTNVVAIRLWKRLGFGVIGTLPGAFRHPRLGFVDALVMFKTLSVASDSDAVVA